MRFAACRLRSTCFSTILVLCVFTVHANAETRTWKDTTGQFSINAELVDHDDSQVILRKADGKQITVPLAKLSDADRAFLKEASKPESDDGFGLTHLDIRRAVVQGLH